MNRKKDLYADADMDGVEDGAEIANHSNPQMASDNGIPDTYLQLHISVGDASNSHSEKWGRKGQAA